MGFYSFKIMSLDLKMLIDNHLLGIIAYFRNILKRLLGVELLKRFEVIC